MYIILLQVCHILFATLMEDYNFTSWLGTNIIVIRFRKISLNVTLKYIELHYLVGH